MAKCTQSKLRKGDNYMEAYMYPILNQAYKILGFEVERNNDKETQLRGLDATLNFKNIYKLTVDEKCYTTRNTYVYGANTLFNNIDGKDEAFTFAFELEFVIKDDDGNIIGRVKGWIHRVSRENKMNDYFVLVFPNAEKEYNAELGAEVFCEVKQLELCLISYEAIKKLIETEGFDYDKTIEEILSSPEVLSNPNKLVRFCKKPNANGKVVYSGHLHEQPINFVIPKKLLMKHSIVSAAFICEGERGNERITMWKKYDRKVLNDMGRDMSDFIKVE